MKMNVKVVLGLAMVLAVVPGLANANLIVNGGFETGDILPATTDYVLHNELYTVPGTGLYSAQTYTVSTSPVLFHPIGTNYGPHTGEQMMILNGAGQPGDPTPPSPLPTVWQQVVNGLTVGQEYEFSYWIRSWTDTNYAVIETTVNGNSIGIGNAPQGTVVGNGFIPDPWVEVEHTFVADSTTATIKMVETNYKYSGCDWSLDDLELEAVRIPAPGAVVLCSLGAGLVGWLRRRNAL